MIVRKTLFILAVCAFCETYRTRRQTTTYKIDTKVVTDVEMYKRWSTYVRETSSETDAKKLDTQTQNTIQEYVSRCFHQANVRLATLNLDFTVQLQLVDIEFNYSAANPNNVNALQTLNTFKDWLVKNSQSNLIDRYDHVMLFTSTALASVTSSGGEVQGLGHAYVGTMCKKDGSSSSVVEDKGGFQSSFQIAHEIAHSLGAQHDSFYPGCSDSSLYLMSGLASDPVSTRWKFSTCSANSIKTYINSTLQSSSASCLTTSSTALNAFESTVANNSGQYYPANEQCQMMYGKTSHVCYGAGFSNISEICTSMFCLVSGTTCNKHFAAEGTSCANGKWCKLGICTDDSKAPIIGSCSLGDNIYKINVNGIDLSCTQAVATAPHVCYTPEVLSNCCASCEKIKNNVTACPYGDRGPGCKKASCSLDASYDVECCGTCQTNNKDSTTAKGPTIVRDSAPGQTGPHVMALLVGCSTLATLFIRNLL